MTSTPVDNNVIHWKLRNDENGPVQEETGKLFKRPILTTLKKISFLDFVPR
jgi:hypothetical protein